MSSLIEQTNSELPLISVSNCDGKEKTFYQRQFRQLGSEIVHIQKKRLWIAYQHANISTSFCFCLTFTNY